LLPDKLVPARIERGRVVPAFLGPQDHPWLGVLMDEIDRFRGRPRRELDERLRAPLPCAAPYGKCRAATSVLLRLWRSVADAPVAAAVARETLFTQAAERPGEARERALEAAAKHLGITTEALAAALFADLPGERIVRPPEEIPSLEDAACRVNLAIAQSLLCRASVVRIKAEGSTRAVVRQARLRGLLCTVWSGAPPLLEVSGAFALFRRTMLYGRALGELLPFLARTARFELAARCALRGEEGELSLRSGDPITPAAAPKAFDSRLEERFARDFKMAAPDWDLVREPEPVRAGNALVFPDFLLRHRLDPTRQHLLEIVGFWTPDYLERKLQRLRAAGIRNLILAIDDDRRCTDGELPPGARVVRYRRRIDPQQILALLAPRAGVP
jgi:predicted nuclease of restriction endonuclease-like RecB superfamily